MTKHGVEKVDLDTLMRSDFVSINCPLTDGADLIGEEAVRADEAERLFHHHRARQHPRRIWRWKPRCCKRSQARGSTCGRRSRRRSIIRC
jgi:hypothetical protein